MAITLKAARVNKELNQTKAGELIGVSKETISNWERGISYPKASLIPKIEEVYGVGYNDILFLR